MRIASITALTAIMLCATSTFAQSGEQKTAPKASRIYIRIGAGYGFEHAGRTDMNGAFLSGSESITGTNYSLDLKRASYGSGVSANIAGGYMITRNVGLEIGVHAIVAPEKYSFSGILPNTGGRAYTSETYAKLPVYVIPAIVFSRGNKLKIYTRTGVVLPVSDKLRKEETRSGVGIGRSEEIFITEMKQHFSIGLQGALGLSYALSHHLSIWVEASAISRNAFAKRSELIVYTDNGVDKLGTYFTNQKVTEYEFSYSATYPAQVAEPDKKPTFSVPFSSLGASVGIKYAF